jgi:hypothetical protein
MSAVFFFNFLSQKIKLIRMHNACTFTILVSSKENDCRHWYHSNSYTITDIFEVNLKGPSYLKLQETGFSI